MTKHLLRRFARFMGLPILALALLSGCSKGPADTSASNAEQDSQTAMPNEAHIERFMQVASQLDMLATRHANGVISGEELYRGARPIVEEAATDEAIATNVLALMAPKLLNSLLQDDNAPQQAVGYFTDMLTDMESPHADMVLASLRMLDGYWTKEQIRTAAHEAMQNAEEWLRRTDEEVRYHGKDRPAIIASIPHLQSIASL